MKIFSWNVNGIRAVLKRGDFERFLKKYDPDILCLQETKAQQEQVEIDLPDYDEYWSSAEKKGYSGTAIFTKVAPLDVILGIPEAITKKYALTDFVSVGVEYLHYEFDDDSSEVIRGRVNARFNSLFGM